MKLGWYRDELKWVENIKSRKTVMIDGKKTVVSNQGVIPTQPRELWAKPKGQR